MYALRSLGYDDPKTGVPIAPSEVDIFAIPLEDLAIPTEPQKLILPNHGDTARLEERIEERLRHTCATRRYSRDVEVVSEFLDTYILVEKHGRRDAD